MERNTQVPKDLRDRPNTVHRRPLTIKPADDTLDDEDIKSDHQGVNTDKSPIQLKQYAPRPVSCNGDCGSQFAKMIHNLTHHETQQIKLDITEEQTIAHAFWLPDSPLRQTLIKQIQNQPILSNDDKYKDMLNKLKDQNLYIKGKEWTNDMTSFFRMLFEQQYIHILHTLANGTCLVPDSRSLFGEYAAYHKRKKERWIGELNRLNEELLNGNHSNDPQQLQKRRDLQQKITNWQPKSAKEDSKDLSRFEARLKAIKQTQKYKDMDERSMALTDTEIYAVMVYCEEKKSGEPDKFNVSCEWKTLFYHLCCAVYKIRAIGDQDAILRSLMQDGEQWMKQVKLVEKHAPIQTNLTFHVPGIKHNWYMPRPNVSENNAQFSRKICFFHPESVLSPDCNDETGFVETDDFVVYHSENKYLRIHLQTMRDCNVEIDLSMF
eukprot:127983_1